MSAVGGSSSDEEDDDILGMPSLAELSRPPSSSASAKGRRKDHHENDAHGDKKEDDNQDAEDEAEDEEEDDAEDEAEDEVEDEEEDEGDWYQTMLQQALDDLDALRHAGGRLLPQPGEHLARSALYHVSPDENAPLLTEGFFRGDANLNALALGETWPRWAFRWSHLPGTYSGSGWYGSGVYAVFDKQVSDDLARDGDYGTFQFESACPESMHLITSDLHLSFVETVAKLLARVFWANTASAYAHAYKDVLPVLQACFPREKHPLLERWWQDFVKSPMRACPIVDDRRSLHRAPLTGAMIQCGYDGVGFHGEVQAKNNDQRFGVVLFEKTGWHRHRKDERRRTHTKKPRRHESHGQ